MFWLKKVYYGLLVLNLVALLLNFRKIDPEKRVFLPIILIALATQATGDVLKSQGLTSHFLFHLYIPLEYVLLCYYFKRLIRNGTLKNLIAASAAAFFLFYLFYYLIDHTAFFKTDFSSFVASALLVSIWVICFFKELFQKEEHVFLLRDADFWINTGNLLFYSGCVFVMGLYFALLEQDEQLAQKLLHINYILNLLLYFLYFIAFTCSKQRTILHK